MHYSKCSKYVDVLTKFSNLCIDFGLRHFWDTLLDTTTWLKKKPCFIQPGNSYESVKYPGAKKHEYCISRDTYDRKLEIHMFALRYPQFQRFWNLACHVFRGVRRSLKTTLPCLLPFVPCTVVILWQQPNRPALLFVEIPQNDQQHLHKVWYPPKKWVPFNDPLFELLKNNQSKHLQTGPI